MKGIINFLLLFFTFSYFSCGTNSDSGITAHNIDTILQNQDDFLKYYYSLKLSYDFIALDENSKKIAKEEFLKKIIYGAYLPLRLTDNHSTSYKLLAIDTNLHSDYINLVRALANKEYNRFKMEGKPLPKFNFTDLNGKLYNLETTRGKIVVVNFWFIHCQNCVAEMPSLNNIVDQFKSRNDVDFISMAFDKQQDLEKFLSKTKFNYAVIPVSKDYLFNDLNITSFPTQMIINRNGLVVKLIDDYQEMRTILEKMN